MFKLSKSLNGIVLLFPLVTCAAYAQVFPTTTQRPLPGAAGAVASPQAGTGTATPTTQGRPAVTAVPGGVASQGAPNPAAVNQGTANQAGVSQATPGQAAANQNVPNQGRAMQGGVNQSSGNQGGSQASGAPIGPGQGSGASPQAAHPPATPASAAPAATPPNPPPAIQPQSIGLPGGGGSGAAVVVVPQGAKRIPSQVTLQRPHKSARATHQTAKSRQGERTRSARAHGQESSGAGQ